VAEAPSISPLSISLVHIIFVSVLQLLDADELGSVAQYLYSLIVRRELGVNKRRRIITLTLFITLVKTKTGKEGVVTSSIVLEGRP